MKKNRINPIWFSWKNDCGSWAEPELAGSAQEARAIAYERRGRRRGGWITGEDETIVRRFVFAQNQKHPRAGRDGGASGSCAPVAPPARPAD